MSHHEAEKPLGGAIITPGLLICLVIIAAGGLLVVYRLFYGLGSVSAQSDGYPWGIWKPLNVVTFTGIAAGAYAMGLVTYVFNKWQYHGLIRSAIMVGAMGYTLAGASVVIDLGRWWNLWVVFWPPVYNLNSVLLEVAICVMAYCMVLWIEVTPAVMEEFSANHTGFLQRWSARLLPYMKKALPFIIALALLLPTMHQSSLGGLYMITVTKLHPMWFSSWVSGLFLISCLTMGFGSVVIVENLTSLIYGRKMDQKMLSTVAPIPAYLVLSYLVIRFGDLAYSHKLGLLFTSGMYSWFFWLEIALFVVPALMLLNKKMASDRGKLFLASMLLIFAGALYRFDTYLTGYKPAAGWSYWPNLGELLFSACLAATGVAVYIVMIKLFPLVSGVLKQEKIRLW